MAIVVALIAAMVSCATPAEPTVMGMPPKGPEVIWRGATSREEHLGQALWSEIKNCTGYDGSRSEYFPVNVHDEGFVACGPVVKAAGCLMYTSIEVVRSYYESALAHEFVHYCMERL